MPLSLSPRLSAVAAAAAAVALVFAVSTPAAAATNPTAKCTLNGVSTGTLQGWLNTHTAETEEPSWGGECGTVYARVTYKLTASGTQYLSGWVSNSVQVYTSSYPYTLQGNHKSTRSGTVTSFR